MVRHLSRVSGEGCACRIQHCGSYLLIGWADQGGQKSANSRCQRPSLFPSFLFPAESVINIYKQRENYKEVALRDAL